MLRRLLLAAAPFVLLLGTSTAAHAQKIGDLMGKESITNRPLLLMIAIAGLALVPFLLIMITSFVKIAVVLSIVRQAIGTQQIPPTQVITGLAIVLTVYIMMPVGLEIYHNSRATLLKSGYQTLDLNKVDVDLVIKLAEQGNQPIKDFLIKHAHLKDRDMFYKLAW